MGTYGRDDDPLETEAEIADAVDAAFGLERDLQLALRRNIEQLEPSLTIIDGDREQPFHPGASTLRLVMKVARPWLSN
jgi:hypothetical protein